jgi:hypothetical protein
MCTITINVLESRAFNLEFWEFQYP